MKKKYYYPLIITLICTLLYSCSGSNRVTSKNDETLSMKIKEEPNLLSPGRLPAQQPLSLGERALIEQGQSRGILAPVAGSLVSMATDAVKKIIAEKKKKYTAGYQFGLTDLYFYDQLSNESPFDPTGLQFSGFKIIRTFINNMGGTDTALTADFVLDTSRISEMVNNSVFRLKVKNFELHYAKAKTDSKKEQKLNLDIEIIFTTSYVNDQGSLFDNIVLGKFYLLLRDAPLNKQLPGYKEYYEKLKDSSLLGKSFIVPRSFGYHREPNGEIKSGYSQGAYSIQINVKESSKNHFITKLIFENANAIIDAGGGQLKSTLSKKL